MKTQHRTARGRRGFTILEVVFAMGILMVGLSVLLGLLSFGAGLGTTSIQRADAAAAVQVVLADLEERLFPMDEEGEVGEPADLVDIPVPGSERLVYSTVATPDPLHTGPGPALYRVDIEIKWEQSGTERALRVSTLMAGQIPFGERLRRALLGASGPPRVPEGASGP